jgi:ribosomal protein S27E
MVRDCGKCGSTLDAPEPAYTLGPNPVEEVRCKSCGTTNVVIYDAPGRRALDALERVEEEA